MVTPELIDKVLEDAKNGQAILIRATLEDYAEAIRESEERGFIKNSGRSAGYRLTDVGRKVLDLGGYNAWTQNEKLEKDRKGSPSIKVKGHAIIGNNNSGNNQGRDFEVLPQIQPETKPSQNANPTTTHEVKMSTAQFIFWLFSALATGIGLGFTIANNLHK